MILDSFSPKKKEVLIIQGLLIVQCPCYSRTSALLSLGMYISFFIYPVSIPELQEKLSVLSGEVESWQSKAATAETEGTHSVSLYSYD